MFTLTYAEPRALLRDLKAIGATNATRARPRALMGRRRFERALAALEAARRDGRIPATFEVIYGHAWKVAPRRTAEGHAIVEFKRRARDERSGAVAVRRAGRDDARHLRHRHGHRRRQDRRRAWRSCARSPPAGIPAVGMKPVAAGIAPGDAINADVAALVAAATVEAPLADVNPYAFAPPIAPHLAARGGGRGDRPRPHRRRPMRGSRGWPRRSSSKAPAACWCRWARHATCSTSPRDWACPSLLVVGIRLGCLNHALLSAQALRARGVRLAGWVANRVDPSMREGDANVATLASDCPAPLVADIGWGEAASPPRGSTAPFCAASVWRLERRLRLLPRFRSMLIFAPFTAIRQHSGVARGPRSGRFARRIRGGASGSPVLRAPGQMPHPLLRCSIEAR